jgi:DNA-binding GntR family transcriptional regulator
MAELGRIEKQNFSQRVYAEIRFALMNGQYQPGDRLKIAELAESLGTSITPVREAIFRLASEKALNVTAATSIEVPELDIASVKEIQLMRELLEGAAAERAAVTATRKEIDALAKIQTQFIKAAPSDAGEAAKINRDFHFGLMQAAHLPNTYAVVENLWVRMGPLLHTFHREVPKAHIYNNNHPHYKVLAGLRAQNPVATANAIREDIRWGERVLIEWLSGRSVADLLA